MWFSLMITSEARVTVGTENASSECIVNISSFLFLNCIQHSALNFYRCYFIEESSGRFFHNGQISRFSIGELERSVYS
jgi:hypothetical protein